MANHILQKDGTCQSERFPAALDYLYAKIDDTSIDKILEWAGKYAQYINYYDESNRIDGNWKPFFDKSIDEIISIIDSESGILSPHYTLLIVFGKLLEFIKKPLNEITLNHLDLFYKRILNIEPGVLKPDVTLICLQLKKNYESLLLKKESPFPAGKDQNGKEILFKSKKDFVIQASSVEQIRSVKVNHENGKNVLYYSPVTNSDDGLGTPLPDDYIGWSLFGENSSLVPLVGCAIASPVLECAEGNRTVNITISTSGKEHLSSLSFQLKAFISGPEGWYEKTASAQYDGALLNIKIALNEKDPAIISYTEKVHGENYETTYPVVKITIPASADTDIYTLLSNARMKSADVNVIVNGLKMITLENEFGTLNPAKTFFPFGPQAFEGSKLKLSADELFKKNLDTLTLNIQWANIPASNLSAYFAQYLSSGNTIVKNNEYFKAKLLFPDGRSRSFALFDMTDAKKAVKRPDEKIVQHWKIQKDMSREILRMQKGSWAKHKVREREMRGKDIPADTTKKNDGIELILQNGFLFKEYRDCYTKTVIAMSKPEADPNNFTLPKEPFSPQIESLAIDYTAGATAFNTSSNSESSFYNDDIQFFHILPTGQMRRHGYLASDKIYPQTIFPAINNDGEMYIGLKNCKPKEQVSILIVLADGSGNPNLNIPDMEWSCLGDNAWFTLQNGNIIENTTNRMQCSGIVTLKIHDNATLTNTILPSGYIWVRFSAKNNLSALCRCRGIYANGLEVMFDAQSADYSLRSITIPAYTIKKMHQPHSAIEKIIQPVTSFGGSPTEHIKSYQTRVSERLRHRNRAVTIWDYERLILEKYPELYKVKCIPHAAPCGLEAPGHVTVIVIPDLKNKNLYDMLAPKVSQDTLLNIKDYIEKRIADTCILHIENPHYETIEISCKIAFKYGYDPQYYSNKLSDDIVKYLSPWAFDSSTEVPFGVNIHKSVILSFVENCEYVNYIEEFFMYHGNPVHEKNVASADDPRVILVSSKKHRVTPV
jgi:hypothetical protein